MHLMHLKTCDHEMYDSVRCIHHPFLSPAKSSRQSCTVCVNCDIPCFLIRTDRTSGCRVTGWKQLAQRQRMAWAQSSRCPIRKLPEMRPLWTALPLLPLGVVILAAAPQVTV